VERRIAPSTRIEEAIEQVLLDRIGGPDHLSQLGRLGAQLILQRAAEDEAEAFRSIRMGPHDVVQSLRGVACAREQRWRSTDGHRS